MIRNLKLLSGLILFLFIALHLINLAIGAFSLQIADDLRPTLMAPFTNPVGGGALIASMLLHMVLGLLALYHRNTLRMSRYDTVQFVSALLIPPLLIPHVWALLAVKQMLNINPSYFDLFRTFWMDNPLDGLRQVLLVVVVWVHGCIGLFTWLRLQTWWTRASLFAYPLAVAIPVMALLGFVAGGNHILALEKQIESEPDATSYSDSYSANTSQDYYPGYAGESDRIPDRSNTELSTAEVNATIAFINRVKWQLIVGYLMILFFVMTGRFVRVRSNSDHLEVHYADGQKITSAVGPSLLELSNMNDIPHANLCRGRGRCGTCKVQILNSDRALPEINEIERETLGIASMDSSIRLACQLNPPAGVIKVKRLLHPNVDSSVLADMTKQPTSIAVPEASSQTSQNTTT